MNACIHSMAGPSGSDITLAVVMPCSNQWSYTEDCTGLLTYLKVNKNRVFRAFRIMKQSPGENSDTVQIQITALLAG